MKKTLITITAAIMILALASCGAKQSTEAAQQSIAATTAVQTTEAEQQSTSNELTPGEAAYLQKVKQVNVWRDNIEWFTFEEKRGTKEDELIREYYKREIERFYPEDKERYKTMKIAMYINDIDNDGREEIVFTHNGGSALLLGPNWLVFGRIVNDKYEEIDIIGTQASAYAMYPDDDAVEPEKFGLIKKKNEVVGLILGGTAFFNPLW